MMLVISEFTYDPDGLFTVNEVSIASESSSVAQWMRTCEQIHVETKPVAHTLIPESSYLHDDSVYRSLVFSYADASMRSVELIPVKLDA